MDLFRIFVKIINWSSAGFLKFGGIFGTDKYLYAEMKLDNGIAMSVLFLDDSLI